MNIVWKCEINVRRNHLPSPFKFTSSTSRTSCKRGNDIKIILQEPFLRIEWVRWLGRKKPNHDSGAVLQQALHLAFIFHNLFNKCACLQIETNKFTCWSQSQRGRMMHFKLRTNHFEPTKIQNIKLSPSFEVCLHERRRFGLGFFGRSPTIKQRRVSSSIDKIRTLFGKINPPTFISNNESIIIMLF